MPVGSNFTGRAIEAWHTDYSPQDVYMVIDLRSLESLAEHLHSYHGRDDLSALVRRLGGPNSVVAYIPVLRVNRQLSNAGELTKAVAVEGLRRMNEELAKQGHDMVDVFALTDDPSLWPRLGFRRLSPAAVLMHHKVLVRSTTTGGPIGFPGPRKTKRRKA